MNLSGVLVAGKRAKAKRRNGLFKQPNGSYKLRKKIKGHLYQIPLVVSDKDDARDVYDQVLKEIALGMHGLPQAPSLAALIDGWCGLHRKQEAHVKTARWCEGALGPAMGKLPLTSITTERLDEWVSAFQEDHKPASINLVLRYLKLWLRWAVKRKAIPGMPCDITMQRVEKRPRPVVKISQHELFLQAVDCVKTWTKHSQLADFQVRTAVRMMLGLGLREAEILGAKFEWLDLEARTYTVGKAKGMKPRTIGVPEWVLPFIQALPRTVTGLLFPGEKGQPHPHNWLRKALLRGARAVPSMVGILGNHRLRASFATRHSENGTPLATIQAMMGHESIITTRGYVQDDLGQQVASQDQLSTRLKGGA